MTPRDMADLHARVFTTPRPWSEQEFQDLLQDESVFAVCEAAGFALGRVILDEAELLTIAVDPKAQRQGMGSRLMRGFMHSCHARGVERVILEVAEPNVAAQVLYGRFGFSRSGLRKAYYRLVNGGHTDAIVMEHRISV